jgi:hypothetical protein
MKNYYIAEMRVFVDGQDNSIEIVSGLNFDLNAVKRTAEERVREHNPGKTITSVLISKKDMDLDEYKKATGGNPPWLGGSMWEH